MESFTSNVYITQVPVDLSSRAGRGEIAQLLPG